MCDECWTEFESIIDGEQEAEIIPDAPLVISWTGKALANLSLTLQSKRSDYSADDEFGNFEGAAEAASIKVEDVMLAQVGIKLGRIKNLRDMGDTPLNEPLIDSYKDLAGYAVLAYAYALKRAEGGGNEKGIYREEF